MNNIASYLNLIRTVPTLNRAYELVRQGKDEEALQIAKNVCESNGKDFNSLMAEFRKSMH